MCCEPEDGRHLPFDVSPEAVRKHVDLDPVPSSVGTARGFVRDVLHDLDADTRDIALLLTSELVTNAILHARTPVQVGVMVDQERALICVADRLGGSPALTPRTHSKVRPGGRGLALVQDLATAWGTTTYTGGKTVWFWLPSVRDRSVSPG